MPQRAPGAAFSRREHSADGLEPTWATNRLAPFLLTELLLPLLAAAPAGRIVNVVSELYGRKLDLGNLQRERSCHPPRRGEPHITPQIWARSATRRRPSAKIQIAGCARTRRGQASITQRDPP